MNTNTSDSSSSVELNLNSFHTECDANNIFREYLSGFPSYDPESSTSLEHLCDDSTPEAADRNGEVMSAQQPNSIVQTNYFHPFPNPTTWRLINWFYNNSIQKSLTDLNDLVKNVLLSDNFDSRDLQDFDARCEIKCLDGLPSDPSTSPSFSDGWHTTSVSICLPCE